MKLEPSLRLLQIPFDANTVMIREIHVGECTLVVNYLNQVDRFMYMYFGTCMYMYGNRTSLLQIYDVIIGRSGAATKLLYQVYIALKKKKVDILSLPLSPSLSLPPSFPLTLSLSLPLTLSLSLYFLFSTSDWITIIFIRKIIGPAKQWRS